MKAQKRVSVLLSVLFALATGAAGGMSVCATAADDPYVLLGSLPQFAGIDVREEYRPLGRREVAYGSVLKFQQQKDGSDVVGAQIALSVDGEGNFLSLAGNYRPVGAVRKETVGEEAAKERVFRLTGERGSVTEKVVCPADEGAETAYRVVCPAQNTEYLVSAADGEILRASPMARQSALTVPQKDADGDAVSVSVEQNGSDYILADAVRNIWMLDCHNTTVNSEYYINSTGVFDPIAVSAYRNVTKAYDFYADERNLGVSLRGADGNNDEVWNNAVERGEHFIMVYVHYGAEYENANCGYNPYSGYVEMLVGDGKEDGTIYLPARASDVIGHEYQHAVTYFAANLAYMNDSAALNEAFSDIFGMLIEGYDPSEEEFWRIGERAAADGTELRSVKGGSPKQRYRVSEKIENCTLVHDHTECDYGGAHQNSTIISHVQYLLWEKRPDFFTRERIGKLWYATLCKLGSEATFDDFAPAFSQSAADLGYGEEICALIDDCLEESGLLSRYTVSFLDYDGTLLSKTRVRRGESVTPPEVPLERETEHSKMRFTGWSEPTENVTYDMTVRAEYEITPFLYPLTFYDMEGNVFTVRECAYGAKIEPPSFAEIPSPYPIGEYIFSGWFYDPEFQRRASAEDTVKGEAALYGKWTKREQPASEEAGGGDLLWLWIGLPLAAVAAAAVTAAAVTVTVVLLRKKRRP